MRIIVWYLKGVLMGLADVVPGVSGSTIALILGIYERFIKNIYSFARLIKNFDLGSIDWAFITSVILGMATSILLLSKTQLFF